MKTLLNIIKESGEKIDDAILINQVLRTLFPIYAIRVSSRDDM